MNEEMPEMTITISDIRDELVYHQSEIDTLAQNAYALNTLYCESHNLPTYGDWEELSDDFRKGYKKGIMSYIDNPSLSAEENHKNWCDFRSEHGWVFGEVLDTEKKTHPNMRPYHELPDIERKKNEIFALAVKAFLLNQTAKMRRYQEEKSNFEKLEYRIDTIKRFMGDNFPEKRVTVGYYDKRDPRKVKIANHYRTFINEAFKIAVEAMK